MVGTPPLFGFLAIVYFSVLLVFAIVVALCHRLLILIFTHSQQGGFTGNVVWCWLINIHVDCGSVLEAVGQMTRTRSLGSLTIGACLRWSSLLSSSRHGGEAAGEAPRGHRCQC